MSEAEEPYWSDTPLYDQLCAEMYGNESPRLEAESVDETDELKDYVWINPNDFPLGDDYGY